MIPGTNQDSRAGDPSKGGPLVCSTDFSIHAQEAADVATWIARKSGRKILLVHVLEPGSHPTTTHERETLAAAKLGAESKRIRAGGADVEERILIGPVVETINQFSRNAAAGMIVMSSLGEVAPSLLVTGSDAEGIAEGAPCPTLVIRNETGLHPALGGERALNILCGYDFSKTADSALRWIRWIRTLTSCNVALVYATTAEAESGSSQESLTQKATAVLGEGGAACRVLACETDAGTALAEVAALEKPDIIVVGTHQRHGMKRLWLGSVSRKVLREAATNVAVVPLTEY